MKNENISDYFYSDEIIASVVINAAEKTDGIFCFAKKPMKLKYLFHSGKNLKYIDIVEDNETYSFVLYLEILNGFSIPKIANNVSQNVKEAVEKITEKTVDEVKVNIVSVHFDD